MWVAVQLCPANVGYMRCDAVYSGRKNILAPPSQPKIQPRIYPQIQQKNCMIDGLWIGNDLERNGHNPIEAWSRHFSEETEENREKEPSGSWSTCRFACCWFLAHLNFRFWRWRQYSPPKPSMDFYCATYLVFSSQTIVLFCVHELIIISFSSSLPTYHNPLFCLHSIFTFITNFSHAILPMCIPFIFR
jgi:hypothetical protein